MSRRVWASITIVVSITSASLTAACGSAAPPGPQTAAAAFTTAWSSRSWEAMGRIISAPPTDFVALNDELYRDLPVESTTVTAGQLTATASTGQEQITETIRLKNLGTLTYHDTLNLTLHGSTWLADWDPSMIVPGYQRGDKFTITTQWPKRATILAADGTALATHSGRQWQAVTPGLAGGLVGVVGPITHDELRHLGQPYTSRSVIGQSGLEGGQERALAGTPGTTVTMTDSAGAPVATLAAFPEKRAASLRTTIDPRVQRAAEQALAGERKHTAALVAINARTGAIIAAVSVNAGFDVAMDGGYPPGSTFKVLTSTALLEHGLTPQSAATCPKKITEDGEVFHNAEGDTQISTLLGAFTESCNTAFIGLSAANLTPPDYPRTAHQYGLGRRFHLGLDSFSGSVPLPADGADQAATAIGQGRVLVSPLDMAVVAAAVDTGTIHAPMLIRGHGGTVIGHLSPAVVSALHTMMASVVISGTAAGTGLPAGTYAKTGTAEYGTTKPLKLDAWLVGFHGDIAFAALVVDSKTYGGPTCGPIVARFLDAIR